MIFALSCQDMVAPPSLLRSRRRSQAISVNDIMVKIATNAAVARISPVL
jgi:hypothetical protein